MLYHLKIFNYHYVISAVEKPCQKRLFRRNDSPSRIVGNVTTHVMWEVIGNRCAIGYIEPLIDQIAHVRDRVRFSPFVSIRVSRLFRKGNGT